LAIALPGSLPAAHQHGYFLIATHQWGEMALRSAAPAATRPNYSEQGHWLRHAFEFVAAALVVEQGMTIAEAKALDKYGKGGGLVEGVLVREFPTRRNFVSRNAA
jgi:hypothetical protein